MEESFYSAEKMSEILELPKKKTKIDELPQLANLLVIIFKPERPEIDEMLVKEIPNYNHILVRPGLSGFKLSLRN